MLVTAMEDCPTDIPGQISQISKHLLRPFFIKISVVSSALIFRRS